MEGNRSILFQLLKLLGKNLTIPLDFKGVIQNSCPGAGACGGMYTANTCHQQGLEAYRKKKTSWCGGRLSKLEKIS
jgi:hypothetical protein